MRPDLHAALSAVDPEDMKGELTSFPEMWAEGRAIGLDADLGDLGERAFEQVVVTGMGGSAIGGDLLRTFAQDSASVPILVNRGYTLPAFVGPKTLVFASSYSGNTEETLSAFDQARARGASVFCVTSGGRLLDQARHAGFGAVRIPGGHPPRAALPYSLAPLLTVAERLGLVPDSEAAWTETQQTLEAGVEAYGAQDGGRAGRLAETVFERLTIIYSGPGYPEAVNVRWRGQWEENAKTLAYGNVFPELNHNEIVGWEHSEALLREAGVLVIRDAEDDPRITRRMAVTRHILADRCAFWEEIEAQGHSRLARMLFLIQLGDWTSLYLAGLNGADPTPVVLIDRLKAALAGE